MESVNDLPELTGRELFLSLSRLGAALMADRLGFGENEFGRADEDEDDDDTRDPLNDSDDMEEDDAPQWELINRDSSDPSPSGVAPSPSSCSFLFPGRTFVGQQRLTGPHREQEDWAVTATIYSCDFSRGQVTGSMVAQNNPHAKRPVVTYFEGEIIDNVNNTFWTGRKWGACPSRETDVRYWARCPGFSSSLRAEVQRHDGCAPQLRTSQFVFMRWKECFFVDVPQDCPLTITGFYYLSLDRSTGAIGGYYLDTRSAPLQVLQLRPMEMSGTAAAGEPAGSVASRCAGVPPAEELPAGMAFGSYSLC